MPENKLKETEIGLIPIEWELTNLGSLISHKKGFAFKSQWFKDSGYPVVKVKDLTSDSIDMNDCVFLDIKKSKEFEDVKLKENDILIATVGSWPTNPESVVGKVVKVPKESSGAFLNQNAVRLRTENSDTFNQIYMFYRLKSKDFSNYLVSGAQGSANQASITLNDIFGFEFYLPRINEQEKIGNFFSSIDKKIQINQKMNQTLEEIGQAIFKHWFVHFEFPNEEGKPYKSSGGEMVDSELGEIPNGWEVGKISDFGKVICGKTPPKSKSEYFDGEVPFIKIPDMHGKTYVVTTEDSLTNDGMLFQKNKTIPKNSVCVSCIATVGLVCLTDRDSQTNQQINSIVPKKEEYTYYLYYMLNSMKEFIEIMASGGSATLNLNTTNFSNIEILIPDETILKKFKEVCEPLFEKILLNSHENENLSKIRDSLLPKLMSGKIRASGENK